MKFILVGLLAAATAVAQQDVRVHAREMNQDGVVISARGDAAISNSSVRIQADSITYNQETGEAIANGNVRIKFITKSVSSVDSDPLRNMTPLERMKMMKKRFPPEIIAK